MKRRPCAWLSLCALVGGQIGFTFPHATAYVSASVAIMMGACIIRMNVVRIFAVLLITSTIMASGASIMTVAHRALVENIPTDERLFYGTVDSIEQRTLEKTVLIARVAVKDSSIPPFRVAITLQEALAHEPIAQSDAIAFKTRLLPLKPPLSPVLFDELHYGLLKNFHARATISDPPRWWRAQSQTSSWSVATLKQTIRTRITDAVLPKDAALLLALMIGDTDLISDEQTNTYRELGAQHLLAISGLQITLIAVIIYTFCSAIIRLMLITRWLHHADVIAAATAIILCFGFTALADFTSSAVRAFFMAALMFLPHFINRRVDLFDALFASGLVTILIRPVSVMDLGFLLSYAACLGLMIADARSKSVYARIRSFSVALYFLATLVVSSCAAFVATFVLLLVHVGSIAPLSIVSNALLLPLACIFQIPAIVMGFLGALFNVSWLMVSAAFCSSLIELWAEALREILGFVITIKSLSSLSLFALGLACVCIFLLTRKNYPIVLAFMALFALIPTVEYAWPQKNFEATVIPVGQGDSALFLMPPNFSMLIDAGGAVYGDFDPGEKIVVPTLLRKGIKKLDVLVISHPDPDHILGAFAVLNHIAVKEIWHSGFNQSHPLTQKLQAIAAQKNISVKETQTILGHHTFGTTDVFVLAPNTKTKEPYYSELSANDNSLVLRFVHENRALLWPGDLEYFGERLLLTTNATLNADLVKAPHHGSKTSSSPEFIARVSPRHVIYSTGRNNRFLFPHDIVVQRYKTMQAKEWNTAKDGEIVITIKNQELMVNHYVHPFKNKGPKLLSWHNYRMTL